MVMKNQLLFVVKAKEIFFSISHTLLETNSANIYDMDFKAVLHSKPRTKSLIYEDLPSLPPGCNINSEFHK